ncbi:MAG: DUF5615 family PIN-like protein [Alphaproteobacteria bacterium]|nr:DUF5615 family PIN-like protein [Alphaproteobacteria bacterium]
MRFLVDTNLPKALATWIAARGHIADHVLDLALAQANDKSIWQRAGEMGAVVVSKDEDFADLARRHPTAPGVVWLRTGNGTTKEVLALLEPIWPTIVARLSAGEKLLEVR